MKRAIACLLATACAGAPRPALPVGPITAIVSDRGQVLSCSQNGVFTGTDASLRPFCVPTFRPLALAPLMDGGFLVAGGDPARSGTLARYARDGSLLRQVTVANDLVYALACDGELVALACADGRVLVCDLPGLDTPRALHSHAGPARAVLLVQLAPVGTVVVSGGRDGRILLTPVRGGATRSLVDHTAGVECLAHSVDAGRTRLYSGALDGKLRVHELDTTPPRLVRTWSRLGAPVLAVLPGPIASLGNGMLLTRSSDDELVPAATLPHAITALCSTGPSQLVLGSSATVTRLALATAR